MVHRFYSILVTFTAVLSLKVNKKKKIQFVMLLRNRKALRPKDISLWGHFFYIYDNILKQVLSTGTEHFTLMFYSSIIVKPWCDDWPALHVQILVEYVTMINQTTFHPGCLSHEVKWKEKRTQHVVSRTNLQIYLSHNYASWTI